MKMEEYRLLMKAALQGCTNLQPSGGFNNPKNAYCIELQCKNCKQNQVIEVKLGVIIAAPSISKEKRSWKSPAHFDQKCPNRHCGQQILVKMIPGFGSAYPRNSKLEYKEIMKFIFDGAEPQRFIFGGVWEYEYLNPLLDYKGYTLLADESKNTSEEKDETSSLIEDWRMEPRILFADATFLKCSNPL
ncbi:hypothetical protein COLO4_30599 [Corchorus olitorius]|uniref:Uncharacterized protein n=1 Tax=Corchorus olitorius TaxID=93759 RepID=A0A1R3H7T1_9ROSI|nr:hypothetical protein COLO4_30599 [Corchorus olitorius]